MCTGTTVRYLVTAGAMYVCACTTVRFRLTAVMRCINYFPILLTHAKFVYIIDVFLTLIKHTCIKQTIQAFLVMVG